MGASSGSPSLDISIEIDVEQSELLRLESNLQKQIVTAKALGREYKSLEANLAGVRSLLASMPTAPLPLKQYDVAGKALEDFKSKLSTLPPTIGTVNSTLELSGKHAYVLTRSFANLGATGEFSLRHVFQEGMQLKHMLGVAGVTGGIAFAGVAAAAIVAGLAIKKGVDLSKEADAAWKEAGVSEQGYFKNLAIGLGISESPHVSAFIDFKAEGMQFVQGEAEKLKAYIEKLYHKETPEEAGVKAAESTNTDILNSANTSAALANQISSILDDQRSRNNPNYREAERVELQKQLSAENKSRQQLKRQAKEQSQTAAFETVEAPKEDETKKKVIESEKDAALATLDIDRSKYSESERLEKQFSIEKDARLKTRAVDRARMESDIVSTPAGDIRRAKEADLNRFEAENFSKSQAIAKQNAAKLADTKRNEQKKKETDQAAAVVQAAQTEVLSAKTLPEKVAAENKVYEAQKAQVQLQVKQAQQEKNPTEALQAKLPEMEKQHAIKVKQLETNDAKETASVKEKAAQQDLEAATQEKNLGKIQSAQDAITAAKVESLNAEIALGEVTGANMDGLKAEIQLQEALNRNKKQDQGKQVEQGVADKRAMLAGAEYGLAATFASPTKRRRGVEAQIEELGKPGEVDGSGKPTLTPIEGPVQPGGTSLGSHINIGKPGKGFDASKLTPEERAKQAGLIEEVAQTNKGKAKRLMGEYFPELKGHKLNELGAAKVKAERAAEQLKADAIGKAVIDAWKNNPDGLPVKDKNGGLG